MGKLWEGIIIFNNKKTAALTTQEGSFYQNTDNGRIFIYMEGTWRWIYDWQTYSSCFDIPEAEAKMVYNAGDPPITSPYSSYPLLQGYLGMKYLTSGNTWTTDGKVYLVVGSNSYQIARHITSSSVFDRYSFDWQKIKRLYQGTNYFPNWITGDPIY